MGKRNQTGNQLLKKEKQDKLENTFSRIRVVNKDGSTSSASNSQNIQLAEATREELQNNLR